MRLLIVLPFLAVGLVGCTNHLSGGTDPFFGRTTVAPPLTGSAATADPAYSSRGLATSAASPGGPSSPPSLFSPSSLPSSMPTVAKAPASKTPWPTNGGPNSGGPNSGGPNSGGAVPLSNSSVPLNIAPEIGTPINAVTTTSNTTFTPYTPSGNPYVAGNNGGLTSVVGPSGTRSSAGPGPKMAQTRVTPLSLTDNRPRTFGQLGQVTIDRNGSAQRATATSSAVAGVPSPDRNTTHTFSTPASRAGSWTAPNETSPQLIDSPTRVIDIMDLPPKGSSGFSSTGLGFHSSNSNVASTTVHHDPAVRLASATTTEPPVDGQSSANGQSQNPYPRRLPESNKPISFTPSTKYGHADNHSWLKGRLEYSQARRCWKLRYIPIDGETDRFGGSVILQKTSLLSGYERGDYVEVKGRLSDDAKTAGDYAPDYEITQIKRIGR